jgi:beta-lactamase regulating signal transducer with metallopeptidase domain
VTALELVLRNLAAWSLQVAVLGLAAAALARLFPIERPVARLAFGQALLALVLGLPIVQPWQATSAAVSWSFAPAPSLAPGSTSRLLFGVPSPAVPAWPAVVAALLLLGVTLRLAQLCAGLVRLRGLRRRARPLEASPWLLALRDDLAPRAVLVRSEEACAPATFGLRRPIVLLPPAFESMSRDRQEAIALHELLHVRRADWLALMLEELLKAGLFFHPAVHWLVGRVRLAREQTVDSEVVGRLGEREAYLESLVEVARIAARARAVPAAPFLRESHLRERVDLLLKGVAMSRLRTLAHVALTTVAIVLAVSWAAHSLPLQASKPAAPAGEVGAEAKAPAMAEPKLVHKVDPVYPADAKTEGVQGIFLIDVMIGKDGAIRDARVAASAPTSERLSEMKAAKGPAKWTPAAQEGDARLAKAALEAVRQWRYEPMLKGGKPVDAEATLTVNFRLH